ncbi:unnamed protein product, partial [Prorocentrum cordatum]
RQGQFDSVPLPDGVVLRNTFLDVPDSPRGGSGGEGEHKARFRTCPELNREEPPSPESGADIEPTAPEGPEPAAAPPPVLLGSAGAPRLALPEGLVRGATVKNGFVHMADEDACAGSPFGGKVKSKTWQAADCPPSPFEDSDEELESTPCVQDMPSPACDDDTPRSVRSMWRNYPTQDLQEDAWGNDGYSVHGFVGGRHWEPPPPSMEQAMSMAQGALGAIEAAERGQGQPPEAAEPGRGFATVSLYGNIQQSPTEKETQLLLSPCRRTSWSSRPQSLRRSGRRLSP